MLEHGRVSVRCTILTMLRPALVHCYYCSIFHVQDSKSCGI